MTRIGGVIDYRALADLHRPSEPRAIASEIRRLRSSGLADRDIAEALRMTEQAVRQMAKFGSLEAA